MRILQKRSSWHQTVKGRKHHDPSMLDRLALRLWVASMAALFVAQAYSSIKAYLRNDVSAEFISYFAQPIFRTTRVAPKAMPLVVLYDGLL